MAMLSTNLGIHGHPTHLARVFRTFPSHGFQWVGIHELVGLAWFHNFLHSHPSDKWGPRGNDQFIILIINLNGRMPMNQGPIHIKEVVSSSSIQLNKSIVWQ